MKKIDFKDWIILRGNPDKSISDNMTDYLDYEYENIDLINIKKKIELEQKQYREPIKKYYFFKI